jgi:myo-inositol-1(or 4)-monophosphatase
MITEIIKEAGNLLVKRYHEHTKYSVKEKYHFLSDVDLEIDKFIHYEIQKNYPDDTFYSEERVETQNIYQRRWIVDPIDGTINFITGEPFFTISIALEEKNQIIEGHVYNPVSDEYFYACKNDGSAYLNGKSIQVSNTTKIDEAIFVVGLSYNREKYQEYLNTWGNLLDQCKKVLFWVAPAQSICNVAQGKVDGFIDRDASIFGQSAAAFILNNARGELLNYDMSGYEHHKKGGIFLTKGLLKYFKSNH